MRATITPDRSRGDFTMHLRWLRFVRFTLALKVWRMGAKELQNARSAWERLVFVNIGRIGGYTDIGGFEAGVVAKIAHFA